MNKKKLIILVIIVLIISFISVFSFNLLSKLNENPPVDNENTAEAIYKNFPSKPKGSSKKYTETESSAIKNEPAIIEERKNNTVSKDLKNKINTSDKKVEISNIKLSFDGESLFLSFTITNKSNSTYDLSKYNLYLYDKNKKVLAVVDASALGKIPANKSIASSIEFETNISTVTDLEFKTK